MTFLLCHPASHASPLLQSLLASSLAGLLGRVLEHNKKVQEAACSSIANIVDEAAKEGKEVSLCTSLLVHMCMPVS